MSFYVINNNILQFEYFMMKNLEEGDFSSAVTTFCSNNENLKLIYRGQ